MREGRGGGAREGEIGYGNAFSSENHDRFKKKNVLLASLTFPAVVIIFFSVEIKNKLT